MWAQALRKSHGSALSIHKGWTTPEVRCTTGSLNWMLLFGGVIMSLVDRCAALSAIRHCGGQATTLSIDRILFKEPIRIGELVEMRGRVVHVGRTSMSVAVAVYAEDVATGNRRHTNECWLTFVHLDDEGRPAPVPPLLLETDEDRRLHDLAARRREQALANRG